LSIGQIQGQAMFAHAVATQLYSGSDAGSIPGSLLNTSPILQSLDAAQGLIVNQVGGAAALRTALADVDDAMEAMTKAVQTMQAGETSAESVGALLDAMNGLNEVTDRHALTLNDRLRVTLDEVARLTKDGLEGIGVTFDDAGRAKLNEAVFAQVMQADPMRVAEALYGDMGLAPGLAAMTDVYFNRPAMDFISEEAVAALNPLNAAGMGSGAMAGAAGMLSGGLSGMPATVGGYAGAMPGPVQGALLSLLG
jgi:hypothetical protein